MTELPTVTEDSSLSLLFGVQFLIMRFVSSRRAAVFVSIVSLFTLLVAGLVLWKRPHVKATITDRALLREALDVWKQSGSPFPGPAYQIFEQQAGQGYYDDAMATAHELGRPDDIRWAVVEVAKIRAENGDVQGAKAALKNGAGSELGNKALREIALVQANVGDLQGALQTISGAGDPDAVLTVFAHRQLKQGDFDGALQTAQTMTEKSADQFFYEVGDALRVRGEQRRIHELASQMSNHRMSASLLELSRFTLYLGSVRTIQATPCDIAIFKATAGQFGEATALLQKNNCPRVSYVAIQQYPTDPAAAERLLRSGLDPHDFISGLADFVRMAAAKGDIQEAMRFLDELESRSQGALGAVHDVARGWTVRDGPDAVIAWARSRQTAEEREWALIGMAEALGHARPKDILCPTVPH